MLFCQARGEWTKSESVSAAPVAHFDQGIQRAASLRWLAGTKLMIRCRSPAGSGGPFEGRVGQGKSWIMADIFSNFHSLAVIGVGAFVSPIPALPNLGGVARQLDPERDRILAWYIVVYLEFLMGVLPAFLFIRALRKHRAGEPAGF